MNSFTNAIVLADSFEPGSLIYALVAIAALWIAIEVLGSLFPKDSEDCCCCSKSESEAAPASPCCGGGASAKSSDDMELHAAVIAAAVATVLGNRPHKISSISYAQDIVGSAQAWSKEGRREIYASHRIR